MPYRRKKHQVFHINLLKEFQQQQLSMQPTQQVKQQCLVQVVKEEEEVGKQFFPTRKSVQRLVSLTHLKPSQQDDLRGLLDPNLFQKNLVLQNWYNTNPIEGQCSTAQEILQNS